MSKQAKSVATGTLPGWVHALASARWSVLFFLLTAVSALAIAYGVTTATALMAAPFALLVANLSAAIVVHARFRTDLPLLLLHLALVALIALFGLARLTYLEGTTTLTGGTAFEGELQTDVRGPLHRGRLHEVRFANDGFTENFYARGKGKHHATYNQVRWQDEAGQWQMAQIGDDHPLRIKGYKIYTTRHRGFSPVFLWRPATGAEEYGTVQLDPQQDGSFASAMAWKLPTGTEAWVMLDLKASVEQQTKNRVDLGAGELAHSLVLRVGQDRHLLRAGQSADLPGGRLTYVRLDSWMGYLISYDPTAPWIIATLLIGIGSLIWFYWRKLW